jgi:TetR/AcrR family transcriptional regulator
MAIQVGSGHRTACDFLYRKIAHAAPFRSREWAVRGSRGYTLTNWLINGRKRLPWLQSNRRADRTRKTILRAAIREFSAHGLAGARTDAIAESAKVNKALLYYYFKSKSGLYAAAIEEVSGCRRWSARSPPLTPEHSAGERLLRTALESLRPHSHPARFSKPHAAGDGPDAARRERGAALLVENVFKPLLEKLQEAVHEGIETGELCPVDWLQVVYSVLGANVLYFLSAPMMRLDAAVRPLDPAAIESRRKAAVQFLGNALFVDRAHGARLAKRVLADMPMPKVRNARVWRKCL